MKKELGYLALGAIIAGTITSGLVHAQTSDNANQQSDPTACERMHEGKMFGKHGDNTNWLADHAELLGITTEDLQTALDQGQTMMEIVEAHGITQDQMHEFMQQKMKDNLAALVAEGTFTQEQADLRLQHMEERDGDPAQFGQFHKRGGDLGQKRMFAAEDN